MYEADEQPMNPISIRLTQGQHRMARKIGNGNVSEGIRTALLEHVPRTKKEG